MPKRPFKTVLTAFTLAALSACSLVKYQPVATINKIDMNQGYRFETSQFRREEDDTFIILMLSGGGTRAAALGYGVLEQLQQQKVTIGGKSKSLMSNVDLVVGVSGGSVLAAYFALKGEETIPMFYKRFLHQNFQRQVVKQAFSMSNLPRLASPEYGRGDLLQEQFENHLFGKATFRDLEMHGKGPFAIISATDMGAGERLNFTQEYFDPMCIDLGRLRLARAVAASSAVPMIFAPITLNNNGGNCGYTLPPQLQMTGLESQKQQNATYQEFKDRFNKYSDSKTRPYIHLIDGGLTDNLGMRSLLDMTEIYPDKVLEQQIRSRNLSHIVVISVNAQNQISSNIDKTAAVPGFRDVVTAIVNIPIDQYTQESLRRFRGLCRSTQRSQPTKRRWNQLLLRQPQPQRPAAVRVARQSVEHPHQLLSPARRRGQPANRRSRADETVPRLPKTAARICRTPQPRNHLRRAAATRSQRRQSSQKTKQTHPITTPQPFSDDP